MGRDLFQLLMCMNLQICQSVMAAEISDYQGASSFQLCPNKWREEPNTSICFRQGNAAKSHRSR